LLSPVVKDEVEIFVTKTNLVAGKTVKYGKVIGEFSFPVSFKMLVPLVHRDE
jgi:hypothetical protein